MNRWRACVSATLLVVSLGLGGCAGSADLHRDTALDLQSLVVAAANQAAAGNPTEALAILDSLQSRVNDSANQGSLSAERLARIQRAVEAVRADLQPPPTPVEQPQVGPAPEESTAPTVEAPETSADKPGNGNNDKGKGKNKDK